MKKFFERIISLLLLLLLLPRCICGRAALRGVSCTYDTTVWNNTRNKTVYTPATVAIVREVPRSGKSTVSHYITTTAATTITMENTDDDWMPIRIHVSSDELDRALGRCNSSGGVAGSSHSQPAMCRDGNALTPRKRDILLNELLPSAIALHSERLLVVRSRFNLVIMRFISEVCYTYVELPAAHESVGVPQSDFVLYVLAETVAPFVAICSEADDGRPTSAAMNFAPADIVNTRLFTRIIAHNLAHALGFDVRRISGMGMVRRRHAITTAEGRVMFTVNSHNTVEAAKWHYGCSSLRDVRLDNNNDMTAGVSSHWDGYIAKDELMSPHTTGEPSGMFYTLLTLSLFEDMKFYRANFSMAETMRWGNNSGCGFLSGDCVEEGKGKDADVFCNGATTTTLQCTPDRFALGRCTRRLSSQHIPLLSAEHRAEKRPCSVIEASAATVCENGNEAHMPGSRLGNTSRCLKGDALRLRGVPANSTDASAVVHSPIGDICANVKCEGCKVSVQYKGDDHWYECKEGSSISPSVTSVFGSGRIVCPTCSEVCLDLPMETAAAVVAEVHNVTSSVNGSVA